jgi:hypothetical protein
LGRILSFDKMGVRMWMEHNLSRMWASLFIFGQGYQY